MKIQMTPYAFSHLQSMAQRTDCEVPAMGILPLEKRGFTVVDAVLVKQSAFVRFARTPARWWPTWTSIWTGEPISF